LSSFCCCRTYRTETRAKSSTSSDTTKRADVDVGEGDEVVLTVVDDATCSCVG